MIQQLVYNFPILLGGTFAIALFVVVGRTLKIRRLLIPPIGLLIIILIWFVLIN